jgi:hypothetical protein
MKKTRLNHAIDTAIAILESRKKSDYQKWKAEEDRKAQIERERKQREAKEALARKEQRQQEEVRNTQELILQQKAQAEMIARQK